MSENKSAIVFGGAGFIGSYLLRELRKTGEFSRVVSADLRPPAVAQEGVEYITCDVRLPILIPGELPNAEIYNLAAIHTTPGHEDWEYFWTNLNGALGINAFADAVGAEQIYFLSSISTYGPTEEARTEEGPMAPISAYGQSKLLAEGVHRGWARAKEGRKLVVVRPAVIFGPGERGNFTRLAAALKGHRFVFPGRNDTIKACAYVGELVRSILFMRKRPETDITYNCAYPTAYTMKEICAGFSSVAGFAEPRIVVPMWLMLIGGWCFEVLAILGLKTSINRSRVLKLVNSTNIVPNLLEQFGYTFETDLHSGLARWREESSSGEFV